MFNFKNVLSFLTKMKCVVVLLVNFHHFGFKKKNRNKNKIQKKTKN